MVADDDRLIIIPKHLSMEEASTLTTAAGPACYALFFSPPEPVSKGTWVLVQGTGGVSVAAIQVSERNSVPGVFLTHRLG